MTSNTKQVIIGLVVALAIIVVAFAISVALCVIRSEGL